MFKSFAKNFIRKYSVEVRTKQNAVLELLKHRKLIKLNGEDTYAFLQGLITNDVAHLQRTAPSTMYAMLLNVKGRVMYDVVLYRDRNDHVYLECDSIAVNPLIKHLKLYRLRKRVDVNEAIDKRVAVVYDPSLRNVNCESNAEIDGAVCHKDPRLGDVCSRLLLENEVDLNDLSRRCNACIDEKQSYKRFR